MKNAWMPIAVLGLLVFRSAAAQDLSATPKEPLLQKGDGMLVQIEQVGGHIPSYREIVDSDGHIQLPFLGLMPAAGKTVSDLTREMEEAYAAAGLSTNAEVTLQVITHFDPPPEREKLVRSSSSRRPMPVSDIPPVPLE